MLPKTNNPPSPKQNKTQPPKFAAKGMLSTCSPAQVT